MTQKHIRHNIIKTIGIFLMSFAVIGFLFLLYLKITTGQGVQTYVSGTQIPQTYIGTAISFALVGLILMAIGLKYLASLFRQRRDKLNSNQEQSPTRQ